MTHRTLIPSALLAAACLTWLPASAETMPENLVQAEVLVGWRTPEGTQMAAVRLTLADGWKTYWRAPGDAGIPPQFNWSGSSNVGTITIHWPKPMLFDVGGMRTIGYKHELVLPVEFAPADPARPMSIHAVIQMGVCKDVCVPIEMDIRADLTESGAPDHAIRAALDDLPRPATSAGLSGARCEVEPLRDGMRVRARLDMPSLGHDEFAVIELQGRPVWVSEAMMSREGGALTATADLVPADARPFALDRSALRITVFGDQGRVVELRGCEG